MVKHAILHVVPNRGKGKRLARKRLENHTTPYHLRSHADMQDSFFVRKKSPTNVGLLLMTQMFIDSAGL